MTQEHDNTKGTWTRELPGAEGFYWYRDEAGDEPRVIFWDAGMQWVEETGSDAPMGAEMLRKITGEFWSVGLTAPGGEQP